MQFSFQNSVGRTLAKSGATLAAVLALGWFAGAAQAQNNAAPQFGSVDFAKIVNESKTRLKEAEQFQQYQNRLGSVLQQLAQGNARFLSEPEIAELATLLEKTPPLDAEKQRLGALTKKADDFKGEQTKLQNTAQPTEAQTKRLNELSALFDKGTESLKGLQEAFETRLKARAQEVDTKIQGELRVAIAKVAKAKNLAVVFSTETALYTANDITADVLKEINK